MADKQPTVHILHGIHVSQPYKSIGKLKLYFEKAGFNNVVVHKYGYAFAVLSRWKNPKRARKLFPLIENGDIVVGHSNGCTLIDMLTEMGAPISGAVLINPALDADKALASQVRWVHVYFNGGDSVVWWSKLLIAHPWGKQGKIGYTGEDSRYSNFDSSKEEPPVWGHSDIFKPKKISVWGPRIAKRVRDVYVTY